MFGPGGGGDATRIERWCFYAFVVLASIALVLVVWPFYSAVLWGGILALLFQPLHRKVLGRLTGRPGLAALATLSIILLMVILPLTLVGVTLVQELVSVIAKVRSGEINFGGYFDRVVAALPAWASDAMAGIGLTNLAALQQRLTAALTQRGQAVAGRALDFGFDVIDLLIAFSIAMYLLFFLLRDGPAVTERIRRAIPLEERPKAVLLERFTTVLRATVKGNVLVAIIQGTLGGLALWVLGINAPLLWGVVMAFLSLLPAIGAALIWGPVALYLIATGAIVQGIGLIAFGILVIGLVDNVLRPILVGKETHLPDYVVLITTVGGLTLVGINGFVIGPLAAALCFAGYELLAELRRAPPAEENAGAL